MTDTETPPVLQAAIDAWEAAMRRMKAADAARIAAWRRYAPMSDSHVRTAPYRRRWIKAANKHRASVAAEHEATWRVVRIAKSVYG